MSNTVDNFEQNNDFCYDKEKFVERVTLSMRMANLDWEQLAAKFDENGYQITQANLKTYVTQRNLSLKVLVYLSKTLGVSMDYLVGNDTNATMTINEGFDYEFSGHRYSQYDGNFYVYFYPTRTNEPEELIIAQLKICSKKNYAATLEIPLKDAPTKKFEGKLLLSKKTDTAFLTMSGCNGEMIQFTFNDPNTFQNKIRFCVAALVSVSSGDSKRMPTLSRAIITEKKLTLSGQQFIEANLKLNSKYIHIQKDKLENSIKEFCQIEQLNDADEICRRLTTAFMPRTIYFLEEQYFLNTFRSENELSDLQVERLISILRNASLSNINCKIPRSLDARLYLLLKDANMFVENCKTIK